MSNHAVREIAPAMRSGRVGFTLVELLVVIGIIALLIAMLMPALTRAKRSANAVACQSNLRQLGQASALYANDWKGAFPIARNNIGIYIWMRGLSKYLGTEWPEITPPPLPTSPDHYGDGSTWGLRLGTVWVCPERGELDGVYPDRPSSYGISQYLNNGTNNAAWDKFLIRKYGSVKKASECGYIAEVPAGSVNLGTRVIWAYWDWDPKRSRYPHANNTVRNVLFVDGHVGVVDIKGWPPANPTVAGNAQYADVMAFYLGR
jgi:prepilin-type processing-associated H-X9-DG protein